MGPSPTLQAAIADLTPFGPDAPHAALAVARIAEALEPYVPDWALTAALTDYIPNGLTSYSAAIAALEMVGVTRIENGWLAPWAMV
jgi:hypothetical protein